MKDYEPWNEFKCHYCGEIHKRSEMHLLLLGEEYICRDCMFEALLDNELSTNNASEFIVALTEGFHKVMKGRVR